MAYCVMVTGLSIGLVFGELRSQLRLDATVTALHGSTFGVGMLVAGLAGNRIVAAFGRARVFWVACASVTTGLMIFCAGQVVAVTLAGATISGFAGAAIVMVMPGLVADHHGEQRAPAFAAINAYPALCGVAMALVVGAAIGAGLSWRWTFVALGLAMFAALAAVGRRAAIPPAENVRSHSPLGLLRHAPIRRAWRDLILAVMVEFPIGVWATVYLKEVGHAGAGSAPVLSSMFGVAMFASRLLLPALQARVGAHTREWALAATGLGATGLWLVPSLPAKVAALAIVGFGAGPLYTSSVDRLYRSAGAGGAAEGVDSQRMGALCALASGVAVTCSPLALGVIADSIGLRDAVLLVPVLAAVALAAGRGAAAPAR